jgi:hypothetical protein
MCDSKIQLKSKSKEEKEVFVKSKQGGKPWALGKKTHSHYPKSESKKEMRMRNARNREIQRDCMRTSKSLDQSHDSESSIGRKGTKLNVHHQHGGYLDQEMEFHLNHCTGKCQTMYLDPEIESVQWLSRADFCKMQKVDAEDFFQLLGQKLLYIKFVDGTMAEITGQYYFALDEKQMYHVFGNMPCHRCEQMLYRECKICGSVTQSVEYTFSKEKYCE